MIRNKKSLLALLAVPMLLGFGAISSSGVLSVDNEVVAVSPAPIKKAYEVDAHAFTNADTGFNLSLQNVTQDCGILNYRIDYMTYNDEDGDHEDFVDGFYVVQNENFFKAGYSYRFVFKNIALNTGNVLAVEDYFSIDYSGQQFISNYSVSKEDGTDDDDGNSYCYIDFTIIKAPQPGQRLFRYIYKSYYDGDINMWNGCVAQFKKRYGSMTDYLIVSVENNALIDGGTTTKYLDVDSKYTQEQILANVSAHDLFGQNVPVTVESSDYAVGKTGRFTIVLKATDNYGLTARGTIIVVVTDYTKPTLSLKNPVRYRYGTRLTEEMLLSNFNVADNMGVSGLTKKFTYPSGFDISKPIEFGNYNLILTVTDLSSNSTSLNFSVEVYDDVAPVISRTDSGSTEDKITIGYSLITDTTAVDVILPRFKAVDSVDGNCVVYIESGTVPTGAVGDFSLTLAAKDTHGNTAHLTITCVIAADLPPVFIFSEELINATADNPLNLTQLKMLVQNYSLRSMNVSNIEVNANGYLNNSTSAGIYPVSYSYYDNDTEEMGYGSFSLEVSESETDNPDIDPEEPIEDNFFVHAFKACFTDITHSTGLDWFIVLSTVLVGLGLIAALIAFLKH